MASGAQTPQSASSRATTFASGFSLSPDVTMRNCGIQLTPVFLPLTVGVSLPAFKQTCCHGRQMLAIKMRSCVCKPEGGRYSHTAARWVHRALHPPTQHCSHTGCSEPGSDARDQTAAGAAPQSPAAPATGPGSQDVAKQQKEAFFFLLKKKTKPKR